MGKTCNNTKTCITSILDQTVYYDIGVKKLKKDKNDSDNYCDPMKHFILPLRYLWLYFAARQIQLDNGTFVDFRLYPCISSLPG